MFNSVDNEKSKILQLADPRRRTVLCVSGTLLIAGLGPHGIAVSAAAEGVSISTAINRAGYIRALSQQIAKAYLQISLDILPEKSSDIMVASQALIQRNIQQLGLVPNAPDAQKYIDPLSAGSKALVAAVTKNISKANALTVSTQADALMMDADRATTFYQSLSKSGQAKIVNIAGRQRMLSQRTAKYYFLIQAGHDTADIRNGMAKSRAEFKAALDMMAGLPISNVQIKSELEMAKLQWGALETSIEQKPNAAMMRNVATTSERILDLMDSLTNQYDQVLKDMLS